MSTDRLRILCIASACPYPPHGGTRILVYHQVRELATHHDVDLVAVDCPTSADCDLSGVAFCRSARLVALAEAEQSRSSAEKVWLTVAQRAPFFVYQRYSAEAQALLDRMVDEQTYDVIVAEDNEAALYVRAGWTALKVLAKHSIVSDQRAQLAAVAGSPAAAARDRLYAALLRGHEQREARRFDLVKLTTDADRRRWLELVGEQPASFVVTNGVDTSFFPYAERAGAVERLIYTGNFAGTPNVDAATWFLDQVRPRLGGAAGRLPFYVVGKSPPDALRARARDGEVVVTGTVPDVRPFFGTKPIAVVPLRVASGIINKVLEPMAMGVPVVASPPAAAGLAVDPRQVCLPAATADEFARAIERLCDDAALYARVSRAAYEYVRERHSWPALMHAYRHRIEHAAGERRRAPGPPRTGAAPAAVETPIAAGRS